MDERTDSAPRAQERLSRPATVHRIAPLLATAGDPSPRVQLLQRSLGNASFGLLMAAGLAAREATLRGGPKESTDTGRRNALRSNSASQSASLTGSAGLHSGPSKETAQTPSLSMLLEAELAARPLERRPHMPRTEAPSVEELSPALLAGPNHNKSNPQLIARRDLHAGASVPDAAAQQQMTNAMDPRVEVSSTGAVTIQEWGGRAPGSGLGTPDAAQNRVRQATLRALKAAVYRELNRNLSTVRQRLRRYNRHRVSTASLEGAGKAAVEVTQQHLGGFIRNAAGTPAVRHTFRGYAAGIAPAARGSANLLDAYDPDDRRAAGVPISAEAVVWWAVGADPCEAVRDRFNFTAPDGSQEEEWLDQVAVPDIANGRRADLELWDRFGFALAPGSRVLATTLPDAGLSTRAGSGGLSPAQRSVRWGAFAELIHEYFHLVEHPAHERARQRSAINSALNEGVTDVLTEDVYNSNVAAVRQNAAIIRTVEGVTPPAGFSVPQSFLPARYPIAYPNEVADVRAALGSASLDTFKAAYLMGHVEYVGLEHSGADRPPVAHGTGQGLDVPASLTTLTALSRGSGVSKNAIIAANPQVTSWTPLPRRLNVPGWREHVVTGFTRGASTVVETRAQIAAQHDIAVSDLDRHNRHIPTWPRLTIGMKVLIPPRGFVP